MKRSILKSPLAGSTVFTLFSWCIAAGYVVLNSGFGSGDLLGFATWSIFGGLLSYPFLRIFQKVIGQLSPVLSTFAASIMGTCFAFGWTKIAQFILGPWILAFSFPVFICWLFGAVAAFQLLVLEKAGRIWPMSLAMTLLVPLSIISFVRTTAPNPPLDLYAILAPNLSDDQEQEAWRLFHSQPTKTPKGYNPEGFRTVSGFDTSGMDGLHITFHPNSDSAKREMAIGRAISSPLIYELWEGNKNQPTRILKTQIKTE